MPSAPTRRHRRLPASVRQHMHIGAKAKVIGFLEKAYTRSDTATSSRINHERRPCARQARIGEPFGAPRSSLLAAATPGQRDELRGGARGPGCDPGHEHATREVAGPPSLVPYWWATFSKAACGPWASGCV